MFECSEHYVNPEWLRNAAAEPWVEPIPPALMACISASVDEVMRDIRVSDRAAAEEGKAESERECWTLDELSLVWSLFAQRVDEARRVLQPGAVPELPSDGGNHSPF